MDIRSYVTGLVGVIIAPPKSAVTLKVDSYFATSPIGSQLSKDVVRVNTHNVIVLFYFSHLRQIIIFSH